MFMTLKRLFGRKRSAKEAIPTSDARTSRRDTRKNEVAPTAIGMGGMDGSPRNAQPSCDNGGSYDTGGACDGGSSGGD